MKERQGSIIAFTASPVFLVLEELLRKGMDFESWRARNERRGCYVQDPLHDDPRFTELLRRVNFLALIGRLYWVGRIQQMRFELPI